jgi:hypothetical protein
MGWLGRIEHMASLVVSRQNIFSGANRIGADRNLNGRKSVAHFQRRPFAIKNYSACNFASLKLRGRQFA